MYKLTSSNTKVVNFVGVTIKQKSRNQTEHFRILESQKGRFANYYYSICSSAETSKSTVF